MRIVHLLNTTDRAAGMVCAAFDLAATQTQMGHEVYVCSGPYLGESMAPLFERHGIKVFVVDQRRKPIILLNAIFKIFRLCRAVEAQIVHAHMMTGAVLASATKPFGKFKLITTVHNEFQRSAVLMGLGARVIAVSESVRLSMIKRGVPARKIRTVLNGTVGSPRFPQPLPTPVSIPRPAITFVGGLHPRKGVNYLITAFRAVLTAIPRAHLYIVGRGPNEEEYQQLAETISASQIVFVGAVRDPRSYLLSTDIFVLPSLSEPAGLVLSEARECGCAVVASAVGGIPEMLDGGEAGILIPPGSADMLATAIIRLCQAPGHLLEMRQKALNNLDRFSISRVAAETELVYREVL